MVRPRHALPLLVVLASVLVAPTVAMPPPEPMCEHCAPAYAGAAADAGLDVRVTESVALVSVGPNGSAVWTVGLGLAGPDADRLRTNESLQRSVARDAAGEAFLGTGPGDRATLAGSGFSGEEDWVYYHYRDEEFARQGVGGALVTTHFRQDLSVANYDGLGVDRLVVHAGGKQIVNAPRAATVTTGLEGNYFTLTGLDQSVVAFAPGGSPFADPVGFLAGQVVGWLSIAAVLWPVFLGNLTVVLVPALVAYALLVGVVLGLVSWVELPAATAQGRRGAVAVLLGAAVVVAVHPLYVGAVTPLGPGPEPALFGLAAGLLAAAVGIARRLAGQAPAGEGDARSLAMRGLATAVVVAGLAGVGLGPGVVSAVGLAVVLGAPAFSLLPAGRLVATGRPLPAVGAMLAGFLLGVLASPALYTAPQGVVLSGFPTGVVAAGAVLSLGWPVFLAGWALSGLPEATATGPDSGATTAPAGRS